MRQKQKIKKFFFIIWICSSLRKYRKNFVLTFLCLLLFRFDFSLFWKLWWKSYWLKNFLQKKEIFLKVNSKINILSCRVFLYQTTRLNMKEISLTWGFSCFRNSWEGEVCLYFSRKDDAYVEFFMIFIFLSLPVPGENFWGFKRGFFLWNWSHLIPIYHFWPFLLFWTFLIFFFQIRTILIRLILWSPF